MDYHPVQPIIKHSLSDEDIKTVFRPSRRGIANIGGKSGENSPNSQNSQNNQDSGQHHQKNITR